VTFYSTMVLSTLTSFPFSRGVSPLGCDTPGGKGNFNGDGMMFAGNKMLDKIEVLGSYTVQW
jgi:hypothetical protein